MAAQSEQEAGAREQSRILLFDPVTEEAVWEEKPIGKNDPIPVF